MWRLKSRKFWLVTFATGAGIVAALFLPAIPIFDWLKESTTTLYGAALGLITVYIGGNVAADFLRLKNGVKDNDSE